MNILSTVAKQTTQEKYFDLHLSGVCYLNDIRKVAKKGKPYLACRMSVIMGKPGQLKYINFDCNIVGAEAENLLSSYHAQINDKRSKVMMGFKLGDPFKDSYIVKQGARAGKNEIGLKARLLQVTFLTVNDTVVYQKSPDIQTTFTHYHCSIKGIGYLSLIKFKTVQEGTPGCVVQINAMYGRGGENPEISYMKFNCHVLDHQLIESMRNFQTIVENPNQAVLVSFELQDLHKQYFEVKKGKDAGLNQISLHTKLIQMTPRKVIEKKTTLMTSATTFIQSIIA